MECKVRHILDGEYNKLVVSQDGKQTKFVLGKTSEMSVIGAQRCAEEIRELLEAKFSFETLKKMYEMVENIIDMGETRKIIKFSLKSLEITMKITAIDEYSKWMTEKKEVLVNKQKMLSPLVVLNIGCTSSGKTLFDLMCVLSDKARKNFITSLTSIKESTNFPISYHVNCSNMVFQRGNNFLANVTIKTNETLKKNIDMQILEATVEMFDSIVDLAKSEEDIDIILSKAEAAAIERLASNKDKTFVIGYIVNLKEKGSLIQDILLKGIQEYYGQSNSYNRVAQRCILESLIKDVKEKHQLMTSDEISNAIYRKNNDEQSAEYAELYNYIKKSIDNTVKLFQKEHSQLPEYGEKLIVEGIAEDKSTKELIDHIFGNKRRREDTDFFSIEAIVEKAEMYFVSKNIDYNREIILVDGLGINQGQSVNANEMTVAYNRIHAAIQEVNPNVILYHSLINGKDDYMLETIRMLSEQGFRHRTFVVFGRLDTVAKEYFEEDDVQLDDIDNDAIFMKFLSYIDSQYLQKDIITLRSLIGDNYFMCDKSDVFKKIRVESAKGYTCNDVLKKVLTKYNGIIRSKPMNISLDKFIKIMDANFVFGKTYIEFLNRIDKMIPMKYSQMRWNVLEKALDELFAERWGHGCLYPSTTLKQCFADQINNDKVREELQNEFKDDYDNLIIVILYEWTNLAHIILVSEYKGFFKRLLGMRYDPELRSTYGVTMTDDRKISLRNLYSSCLQQDGMETLRLLVKIVWKNKLQGVK